MSRMTSLRIAAALLLPLAVSARPALAEIIYTDFSSVNGLALVGDVQQVGTALRLSPGIQSSGKGVAAWYGSEVGVSAGFSTEFSFVVRDRPANWVEFYDGFTFTVQDGGPGSLRRVGEELGYGGLENSLAFAFRPAFQNGLPWSSIDLLGGGRPTPAGWPHDHEIHVPGFDDGRVHTAKFVYERAKLDIFFDDMAVPRASLLWSVTEFMCPCDQRAYVGFTAGRLGDSGSYDILSWRMKSLPEPGTLALLGVFGGMTVIRRRRPGR